MTTATSNALATYRLAVFSDHREYPDDSIDLLVTARWLPRVGDTLNFDGPGGVTLVAAVTSVMHCYGAPRDDFTEPVVDVDAKIPPHHIRHAEELFDPVALVEWAQPFAFLEAQPSRQLVVQACVEVGMDSRTWETVTDWNDWAKEVRARRTTASELP
ncbi:hypothetical protein [Nocardia cyriacigeorgica]|uniref:hypothetical protein n=1 Tax=Nocardia cyriacigeorgica TaxID=135487 RepID=UPI0018960C65|nr:hypothetical protein [Nocardia cyriacigeorgica]MBF6163025.1 hypothetical protein [Nocardia cyriacigeorgica]MBF6201960.1 hypothetical protein [Nocardia cyriacigeorgica]